MLSDEQYGRYLGVRLHDELEEVRPAPDLVRRLRRLRAHRTWAVRAAIGTPILAAAAAVAMVTTTAVGLQARTVPSPDGGVQVQPDGIVQPQPDGEVRLRNVSYVQEQTVKALSRASEYIIYEKTTYSGGYYETWYDKTVPRYRNDVYGPVSLGWTRGTTLPAPDQITPGPIQLLQSHAVSGPPGDQTIVTVDYQLRTWSTDHMTDTPPASAIPDITEPETIRQAVKDGTLELLGEETVDGSLAVHLRIDAVQRGYRVDMWVDAETFLPVKMTDTVPGEQQPRVTMTYSWLPRSEENLAHLELTPPPGFDEM